MEGVIKYLSILFFILFLPACSDEESSSGQQTASPAGGVCSGGLCFELVDREDDSLTPELKVKGITIVNGYASLFTDFECTDRVAREQAILGEVVLTAPQISKVKTSFWMQYENPYNILSPCVGPLVITRKEEISLELTRTRPEGDLTPSFNIVRRFTDDGTVQLFSDAGCAVAASGSVAIPDFLTANELPQDGDYQFWVKAIYEEENENEVVGCFGPIDYQTEEKLTLSLGTGGVAPGLSVGGLSNSSSGTIQLFSDSACTMAASSAQGVGSSITANPIQHYQTDYYLKHIDGHGNESACLGPASYSYLVASNNIGNPGEKVGVSGILSSNGGTAQLFSDSTCAIPVSNIINVTTDSKTIPTLNFHVCGSREVYFKHEYSNRESDCSLLQTHPQCSPSIARGIPSYSCGIDPTPTFQVDGLSGSGTIQLFSDSACTTSASGSVNVGSGTESITATALADGTYNFYAKYTDGNGDSSCTGGLSYERGCYPTIARQIPSYSCGIDPTPTFQVDGLSGSGTIQLFSDSACTTSASGSVNVGSGTESITATALADGTYNFYAKYIDGNGDSSCTGGLSYERGCYPTIARQVPSYSCGIDPTPTFQVDGLSGSGTIQLFSDSACTTSASGSVNVGSGAESITATALADGTYNFYAKYTDGNGDSSCTGGLSYERGCYPTIARQIPSYSCGIDPTPTFEVSNLDGSGTIQLFSDSTCTTSASASVSVGSGTESITANSLADGTYNFYTKYTDGDGNSACTTSGLGYERSLACFWDANKKMIISAGDNHSCVSTYSGGVKCWGRGSGGQLGNNTYTSKNHPVDVVSGDGDTTPLTNIVQVSAGEDHICAVTSSGGVKCWGSHDHVGQLGDNTSTSKNYPVNVVSGDGDLTPLAGIVQVSAGQDHTCAVTSSGGVKCWGGANDGQLGHGSCGYFGDIEKWYPVDVVDGNASTTPLTNIVQVSAGWGYVTIHASNYHTCAVTSSGGVKCWGEFFYGQLGNHVINTYGCRDYPVDVVSGDGDTTPLTNIVQVSAGGAFTCALTASGNVKCWGRGSRGQLGNDATADTGYPVDVVSSSSDSTPLGDIVQVSAGGAFTCAVTSSGGVKCWGWGQWGTLGNNDSNNTVTNYPVDVVSSSSDSTPLAGIVQVSSGSQHTCAVTSSGGVKCWGWGQWGALGNNDSNNTVTNYPVDVVSGDGDPTPLGNIIMD